MMNYEKLEALLQNEKVQEELSALTTVEEIQAVFAKHGVEMTRQEVEDLCVQVALSKDGAADGELSEDALENVSGGFVISFTAGCIYAVGCACVCT